MRKPVGLQFALALVGCTALTACGGSDTEFCTMLDDVKTALNSDDASLRGERSGPADPSSSSYTAKKSLPGAAKCEILDGGSGVVVYSCNYPGTAIEALRDRIDACGGEKLAWDESGKQWYRGAGDNLTLSVTTTEAVANEPGVSAILYTRF